MTRGAGRRTGFAGAMRPAAVALSLLVAAGLAFGDHDRSSSCSLSGTVGLLRVRSAELQTRGVLAFSLAGHYYESLDLAKELSGGEAGRYTSVHLNGSYGLTTWLELGVDVPFRRAVWTGETGDARGEVLDNPSVGVKLGVPLSSRVFSLAVEGRFSVPLEGELVVGDGVERGDTYYLTGGSVTDWEVVLLATADLTEGLPLRLHANIGWASHQSEDLGRRFYPDYYPPVPEGGSATDNDALILRGAVEFPGRSVSLFTEFVGDILNDRDLVALKENPLCVTPGVRVAFGGGWSATAAFTVGISGNDRATEDFDPHGAYPDWEVTAAIGYAWPVFAADTDGDGIPDFRDRCPTEPEDLDGFEDDDGCPDPDNDGDGIPDEFDGAPNLPEDFDGFEDADGVPDLDNDGDGIVDERDMCPDEKEDLDGFEDEDGCPDP